VIRRVEQDNNQVVPSLAGEGELLGADMQLAVGAVCSMKGVPIDAVTDR